MAQSVNYSWHLQDTDQIVSLEKMNRPPLINTNTEPPNDISFVCFFIDWLRHVWPSCIFWLPCFPEWFVDTSLQTGKNRGAPLHCSEKKPSNEHWWNQAVSFRILQCIFLVPILPGLPWNLQKIAKRSSRHTMIWREEVMGLAAKLPQHLGSGLVWNTADSSIKHGYLTKWWDHGSHFMGNVTNMRWVCASFWGIRLYSTSKTVGFQDQPPWCNGIQNWRIFTWYSWVWPKKRMRLQWDNIG